ncbi:MAG TPA: hypothetical protein VGV90_15805, partial [Solirubrobacteraceae bacterium]|nr:hypothetical protein [Solirubrobacteraceae bacterium]
MEVGARSALVRVTVALGRDVEPARALDAQLVVRIDGTRERRHRALPAPPDADATQATLGFAVTRRAEMLALEIGGRSLPLPEPVVREGHIGLAPPATPAATTTAIHSDPDALEQRLRTTRARLEEARAAAAVFAAERDGARQAAARAEAAAHDATARADASGADPVAAGAAG